MISQKEFLTREYIDELYATNKWSPHGAELYDCLDDKQDEDDFPVECQGRKMTFEEMLVHPAFRIYFEAWLPQRFRYAKEWLERDLKNKIDKEDGLFIVNRTIFCDSSIFERAKLEDFDIGRFWSTHNSSAYCGEISDKNPIELTVSAKISLSDIDKVETMRSRMDYTNGDVESEIYLKKDATPVFIYLSWNTEGDFGETSCLTEKRKRLINLKALNKTCFNDNVDI